MNGAAGGLVLLGLAGLLAYAWAGGHLNTPITKTIEAFTTARPVTDPFGTKTAPVGLIGQGLSLAGGLT